MSGEKVACVSGEKVGVESESGKRVECESGEKKGREVSVRVEGEGSL